MTRILGVDPGLETTGYGLIELAGGGLATHLASGVVTTRPTHTLPMRLTVLYAEFSRLLTELRPQMVVLEELYAHYEHPMTAVLMGHARGVISLAVAQHRVPLACYLPTRVKKAVTGNGHATKVQVQGMVTAILGLPRRPEPNDVSDALALALTHSRTLDRPSLGTLARTRRRPLPAALQALLTEARA